MGNHFCIHLKNNLKNKRNPIVKEPNPTTPLDLETILENYFPRYPRQPSQLCSNYYTCERRPLYDTFTPHGCNHSYCSRCTLRYIISRIQNNVVFLNCPEQGCYGQLSPQYCSQILPHDVLVWWERALCESVIPEKDKFYCPFNDCSALLVYSEPHKGGEIRSSCPHCERNVCAKCRSPWHSEVKCEKYQKLKNKNDALMIHLAKRRNWKRCPNCKHFVEKQNGCDNMTCRCLHRFCYHCGDSIRPHEPHDCPGK